MKSHKPIKYIQDLFDIAGSSTKLAAKLDVHCYTVENWRNIGVPQKYWERIYDYYGISPAELFSLSKSCKKKSAIN